MVERQEVIIPQVDWDRFLAFSAYRFEVLDLYISPRLTYPESVQNEMRLVDSMQKHLVEKYNCTPHEVFLLWESYTTAYRLVAVNLLKARLEKAVTDVQTTPSRFPNA
jgi:hypothetical protein